MKNGNNKRLVIAIMLVAVILITVGGTFAYFITQAGRNEEQKLTIKTGNLALTFEDNDSGLTGNIMIGESREKLFIIRNTGTEPVTTNMYWHNLLNTYLKESLSYTFEYKTTEDGDFQPMDTASENIPRTIKAADRILVENITIPADTTYYYKLTITFNNLTDVNQEIDRNAKLMTEFKLGNEEIVIDPIDKTLTQMNINVKSSNPTFANAATTDETADGLYTMQDDYGTSYYYRGAVENNYVKFGGFFWRIIRINGDGSVRMIYDGTQAWPNGNGASSFTTSGADRFTHTEKAWNANYNDVKYVGWMYGPSGTTASTSKEQAQTNTAEVDLKKNIVDPWYKTNIADKGLSKYVGDEIFCNDRTTPESSATGWSSDTGKGFGSNATAYGPSARTNKWNTDLDKVHPTFVCPEKNDAFTVSDTTKGNGSLTYPVGLITADEIVAAGSGKYITTNRYYYLYKTSNYWYWSLSPICMSANGSALVFAVSNSGLYDYFVFDTKGAVAPVINISPEYAATLTGSGTMTSPYQIPGVE